jgi:1-acyl-sn-glycerol-3-phosphate acyltransferase
MPDVELKPQVYSDSRPEDYFSQFHTRARSGRPGWTYELTRFVLVPYMLLAFRTRALDSYNVPNGPVILAPNHGSFMDHFFTGGWVRRRVRFMAKSQLFGEGLATYIFSHGGVFPVRRGKHDEEAFITAFELLGRGEPVVMYPEGGRSRTGDLAPEAKPGVGRLALESGAPVVPVAILGSYRVRNWKRLQFPRVTVQYGTPFRFERVEHSTREQQQEVADYILDRVRELHSQLRLLGHRGAVSAARERRKQKRQEVEERYAISAQEEENKRKAEEERKEEERKAEEEKRKAEEEKERKAEEEKGEAEGDEGKGEEGEGKGEEGEGKGEEGEGKGDEDEGRGDEGSRGEEDAEPKAESGQEAEK